MAGPPKSIEDKLRAAWEQEWRYYCVRGASRFLIWLLALLGISFLIDWGLFARRGMGTNIGLALLVINILILGAVLWFEWLRYLKPFDPVKTSLDVENKHPELSSLLVSYTQLTEAQSDQPNVSDELIGAMRDQAVERSRRFDFRDVIDFAQLKKLFMVAGCVLLLFAILSIKWGEHFGVLLSRLGGSNAEYPTKTEVLSVSENLVVRFGDSANIVATAGGERPDSGLLYTRPAGSEDPWKRLPMDKDPSDAYERELEDLTSDLDYYVRLGDDRSDFYRITVIRSPQVKEAKLVLTYPDYLDRAFGESDQLDLEVPEGTSIYWHLKCDRPVKNFAVRTDRDGKLEPPKPGTETTSDKDIKVLIDEKTGTELEFVIEATKAFNYTFHWTEKESTKDFEFDDVQYSVQVVPDRIPEVEMLRPTANLLATEKKVLKLAGRATDDHGLDKAWLVYSIDGSEEEKIQIHDFDGAAAQDFRFSWKVKDSISALKENSELTFAIEVADLNPDRDNHTRRSAARQLTIVSEQTYLEWFRSELAAQNDEIKRARADELASKEKVEEMRKQEDPSK